MSKAVVVGIGIAFIWLIAIGVFVFRYNRTPPTLPSRKIETTARPNTFEKKISSGGDVDITVTPRSLKVNQPSSFEIIFDTHSVELDFDVSDIVILIDDRGNSYTSPSWVGALPGGHHRRGILTFSKPLSSTAFINLVIKDVGDIPERKLRWDLLP